MGGGVSIFTGSQGGPCLPSHIAPHTINIAACLSVSPEDWEPLKSRTSQPGHLMSTRHGRVVVAMVCAQEIPVE